MDNFTDEEIEVKKKEIFDSMGPRNQKRIMKAGYEEWNPFEKPKDPIDIRVDKTQRTTQQLIREFLQNCPDEDYDNSYAQGALELALGIMNENFKYKGMFEFACWYKNLLIKEEALKKE